MSLLIALLMTIPPPSPVPPINLITYGNPCTEALDMRPIEGDWRLTDKNGNLKPPCSGTLLPDGDLVRVRSKLTNQARKIVKLNQALGRSEAEVGAVETKYALVKDQLRRSEAKVIELSENESDYTGWWILTGFVGGIVVGALVL